MKKFLLIVGLGFFSLSASCDFLFKNATSLGDDSNLVQNVQDIISGNNDAPGTGSADSIVEDYLKTATVTIQGGRVASITLPEKDANALKARELDTIVMDYINTHPNITAPSSAASLDYLFKLKNLPDGRTALNAIEASYIFITLGMTEVYEGRQITASLEVNILKAKKDIADVMTEVPLIKRRLENWIAANP